ncbi:Outer membrane protein A precursor [compost metagenome]
MANNHAFLAALLLVPTIFISACSSKEKKEASANPAYDSRYPTSTSQPSSSLSRAKAEMESDYRLETLSKQILFRVGSRDLSQSDKQTLERIASELKAESGSYKKLNIVGYADPQGDPDRNMKLSQDRANVVRDYLISRGVDANKLDAIAKGSTDTSTSGMSKSQLARDRRVQFEIVE